MPPMSVPKLRPGTGRPPTPIPWVRSPTARPASFITSLPESPGSPYPTQLKPFGAQPDLRDYRLPVPGAMAGRADVVRASVGEDEVHRATRRRHHAGPGRDSCERDVGRAYKGWRRPQAVRLECGVGPRSKRYL